MHSFDSPENVRIEDSSRLLHVHSLHRIHKTIAGIVDPHIDPPVSLGGKSNELFQLAPVAYIAGESRRSFEETNSLARRFGPSNVARYEHHVRALTRKFLCNGLSDAHGSTGNDYDFSLYAHAELVFFPER